MSELQPIGAGLVCERRVGPVSRLEIPLQFRSVDFAGVDDGNGRCAVAMKCENLSIDALFVENVSYTVTDKCAD